eukprot:MONOS_1034.1-p1 / transcript=MONOS_1034.1 / gene=MONOS_1034 / organism=Monocercomonoides_exilis_PA203 / gene_product=unspecified product / transcript_product=unspecified product / location=Mono_scaffold00017:154577-162732(+) / protein_length=2508 / sequence_SO=supercontig / SO=protein_coding / is_pseudo=false
MKQRLYENANGMERKTEINEIDEKHKKKDWGMTIFCIAIFVIVIVSHTEEKGRDGFDNRSITDFYENEGKTNTSGSAFASAFANEKIRNTFMRDIVKDEMLKVAKVASPSEEKGVFVVKNSSVHFEGMKIECSKNAFTLKANDRSLIELFACEIGGMDLSKKPFGVGSGKAIMENVSMIPTRDFGCLEAPLIEGNEYLEFVLRESVFVDAIIGMKESSLLCGGSFVRVSVMECNFKNITRGRAENGKQEELKLFAETCEVSGSYFVDCFQPYYGTVVAPSKISFSCKNTSYVGCANSAVEEKNQTFNERKVFAEGDIKITDCFFKCTSPTENGGALKVVGASTTCELLRCWFNECSCGNSNPEYDYNGGCTYFENVLNSKFFDTNATNCNSSYVCGGIHFRGSRNYQVKCCNFLNCSAQYYSSLSIYNDKSGTVSSCIIKNGEATEGAGGLNYWSGFGITTTSDCVITNCHSVRYGALSFRWSSGDPIGAHIYFIFFSGNSLNNKSLGADISTHEIWVGKVLDEDVKYCYSTSANLRATDGGVNKTAWLPNPPTASDSFAELYVSWRRGEDTVGWGDRTRPFKTVKHALSVRERRKITVVEGEYGEMSVNVGECTMVFDGDRRDNSKVISERVMAGSGLFEVTSGELMMSKFSVIHNSSSSAGSSVVKMTGKGVVEAKECVFQSESEAQANPFQVGFVEVSDGVAKFADCLFANIELRSTAMVVCGSVGNVEFVRTEFGRVVRDEGNGSVMDVRVGDGECLEVMEWKLVGCVCRDGNGGGLKCEVAEGGVVVIENSTFEGCEARGSEGKGGGMFMSVVGENREDCFAVKGCVFERNRAVEGADMFVVCEDLNATILPKRFDMELVGEDGVSKVELRGRDNGRFARESVDLLLFLVKFSGDEVHVSEGSGMDVLGCGKEEIACGTLWCGIGHLKEESVQEEQKVVVGDRCVVSDCFVFERGTMICGPEAEEAKQAKMQVESELKSDGREAVMWSGERLSVRMFVISLPQVFGAGQSMVLGTEGGVVNVSNVGFEWRESGIVGYRIVSTLKGMLNVQNCSVREASFEKVPFAVHSSVVVESLEADGVTSEGSRAGGVMEIELSGEEKAVLRSTNARGCKCSVSEGRGGFVHVNGSEARSASLLTLRGVVFEGNEAWKGKNVYLECADLNGSVNEETFVFEFGEMEKDSNLFVGSDGIHKDTDLFRFLVGYENWMVHVSWSGHDVKRCGSEADPCHTFWKGMGQMEAGQGKRKMVIGEKSEIRDEYKVRDFEVVSFGGSDEKRVKSEMVFGMGAGGNGGHLEGEGNLELSYLTMSAMAGFVNKEGSLVTSRSGMLMMKDCKLSWDGDRDSVMEVSFVQAVRGQMVLEDVRADSVSVGKSMIVASHEVSVQVRGMRVSSCNISSGSVIEVVASSASTISRADLGVEAGGRKQQKERNSEEWGLVVNRSEFVFVKGAGDGSRVVSYLDWMGKGVELVDCVFTGCEGAGNEKGGAIFVEVGADGWYELRECRVEKCGCSTEKGRGGGMYVRTDGAGKLGMLIAPKKFEANTAFAGRDVFVECDNLRRQINETHFRMSFDEDVFVRQNAILGIDRSEQSREPMDLLDLILVYQADTIIVSSAEGRNGDDKRQCGVVEQPCLSVGYGLMHVSHKVDSRLIVDGKSVMDREMEFEEVSVLSRGRAAAEVAVAGQIEGERRRVVECRGAVEIRLLAFQFAEVMEGGHCVLFGCTEGSVSLEGCEFSPVEGADASAVHLTLIEASGAEVYISDVKVAKLEVECVCEVEGVGVSGNVVFERLKVEEVKVGRHAMGLSWQVGGRQEGMGCCEVLLCSLGNVSFGDEEGRIAEIDVGGCLVEVFNSSFVNEWKGKRQGELALFGHCTDMKIVSCLFCGGKGSEENGSEEEEEVLFGLSEVCKWNGSVVELEGSAGVMRDTRVEKSGAGGLLVDGGKVRVEKGEFVENKVHIAGYESVRRNVRCSGGGEVDLRSLKGGDGAKENSSLWILEEGCSLLGIAAERASPLFIPELEEVGMEEEGESMHLIAKGELLLPCNLSLKVIFRRGDEEATEGYEFDEEGFVWEKEAHARIHLVKVTEADEEIEISCFVKFGSATAPSYTRSVMLKNRSEPKVNGDERVVEGGKEGKSGEKEAEKKNEERMKKRVYEKSLGHSESSEHLLSESGSTEYILGKDSDKIPDWALEKEVEEETRKRTPSPSISSTSTTDSDSTFVRGEDLCPTTSSMSNLVDAMACSSPFEKLIVDLRDSLFMLLHGRNEKKEMAIGSLQEREMTAAQILFWVANLALHSFDEMENPLQSLSNLSPHIVLFSEHMVICIVMHSDLLSDDDSDSSSISSSTVVTSASGNDDDESDSLPSSAFEDEDSFKKECLRWKAPELLNGTKKHATKKTVVFSIGMMLWECLTLQIPFGDYEAETAGEKIKNGERPNMEVIETSSFGETTKACVTLQAKSRPTLVELKREFFGHFPAEVVVVTASDAIDDENVSDVGRGSDIGSSSFCDTSYL